MKLDAVLTGTPQPMNAKSGRTGFYKAPRSGPVEVTAAGLEGDHILDTEHHGGPDQAVYLIGTGDYDHWQRALGRSLGPGAFGENLLIDGWTSAEAAIGDRFMMGDCVLELTAPRIPCATLAAVMGDPEFPKRFFREGHPGAYARVLRPGHVTADNDVTVEQICIASRITMADCLHGTATGFRDPEILAALLRVPAHHALSKMAYDVLDKM